MSDNLPARTGYVDKSKIGNMDPEGRRAMLAKLGPAKDRTRVTDLPQWVKLSLLEHELLGRSWNQICKAQGKKLGRSERAVDKQLSEYRKSPAAAEFIAALAPLIADPVELGKAILRANAANVAIENIIHYEAAKEAGDVAEAGKQLRFITEAIGMPQPKRTEAAPPTSINITFSGGTITAEIPMGESEGVKVVDAEIIEDA